MNLHSNDQLKARLQRAWQQHQAGQLKSAERSYRKILSLSAGHCNANNLMGLLCIQTSRPELAATHIQRALKSDPDNPQSHYNLGIACKDLGRLEEAGRHFSQTVKLAPENIEAMNSLGNSLRLQGQHDEAEKWFGRILERQPRHPGALCNLGYLLNKQQQFKRAGKLFREALVNQPKMVEAINGLGEVHIALEDFEPARKSLRQAVQINGNYADAWNNLGVANQKLGFMTEALTAFEKATELRPVDAKAWTNLGLTREQTGSLDDAVGSYRQAINADCRFVDAHFFLAHLRSHVSTSDEIEAMEQLLNDRSLKDEDRMKLAFGLGCALESMGGYSRAFEFMSEGHRIQGREQKFKLAEEVKRFERIKAIITRDLIDRLSRHGTNDTRPVLLAGMPRSGTTLAEQVLASHPRVHGTGESMALAGAVNRLANDPKPAFPLGLEPIREDLLRAEAKRYLGQLCVGAKNAARITDTTPMNFLYTGLAACLLPDARFVQCLRDPLDNCLSIYRQMLTGPRGFEHNLEDLGGYYRLHAELLLHWKELLGDRLYVLQYENLVAEPETEIRRLLNFCGLPYDEHCLAFHETDRVIRSPSASQVRQPLYASSVGSWKRYESNLQPLRDALGDPIF